MAPILYHQIDQTAANHFSHLKEQCFHIVLLMAFSLGIGRRQAKPSLVMPCPVNKKKSAFVPPAFATNRRTGEFHCTWTQFFIELHTQFLFFSTIVIFKNKGSICFLSSKNKHIDNMEEKNHLMPYKMEKNVYTIVISITS